MPLPSEKPPRTRSRQRSFVFFRSRRVPFLLLTTRLFKFCWIMPEIRVGRMVGVVAGSLLLLFCAPQPSWGVADAALSRLPVPALGAHGASIRSPDGRWVRDRRSKGQRTTGDARLPKPLGLHLRGGFEAVLPRVPVGGTEPLHELYRSCLDPSAPVAFSSASTSLAGWAATGASALLFAELLRIIVTAVLQRVWQHIGCLVDSTQNLESHAKAVHAQGSEGQDAHHPEELPLLQPQTDVHEGQQVTTEDEVIEPVQQTPDDGGPRGVDEYDAIDRAQEDLITELSRLGIQTEGGDGIPPVTSETDEEDSNRHEQTAVEKQEEAVGEAAVDDVASEVSNLDPSDTAGSGSTGSRAETAKNMKTANPVLDHVFGDAREHDGMQEAATPPGLTTELMTHQKMGLAWMQRREEGGHVATTWWEQVGGGLYGYDSPTWVNLLTGQDRSIDNPPMEARGGILADDMGLGKTLTILALIVSDLAGQLSLGGGSAISEASPEHQFTNSVADSDWVTEASDEQEAVGPTLIVCPLSVLHNWQTQIAAHANKGLKMLVYHGAARTRELEALTAQHVVLTTYSILQSDLSGSRGRDEAGEFVLSLSACS